MFQGVAHGLVEKIAKSHVNRTNIAVALLRPLLFKIAVICRKSMSYYFEKKVLSALKAEKNYSKNAQDWCTQLFFDDNTEVKKADGKLS